MTQFLMNGKSFIKKNWLKDRFTFFSGVFLKLYPPSPVNTAR